LRSPDFLTPDQKKFVRKVIEIQQSSAGDAIFIDGPAGCGKTYLMNLLIIQFRREALQVLVTASSGVPALMLDSRGTAHSKLKKHYLEPS
jgi:chromosomal replication initiation ATPase DnaA